MHVSGMVLSSYCIFGHVSDLLGLPNDVGNLMQKSHRRNFFIGCF